MQESTFTLLLIVTVPATVMVTTRTVKARTTDMFKTTPHMMTIAIVVFIMPVVVMTTAIGMVKSAVRVSTTTVCLLCSHVKWCAQFLSLYVLVRRINT